MDNQERLYYIWLTKINGVGPILSRNLLKTFSKPSIIYSANQEDLLSVEGIGKEIAKRILDSKNLKTSENILNQCIKKNIKILTLEDELYPEEAKLIKETPILLYYRGNILKKSMGIGIVGKRRCTAYGKRVAVEAATYLAKNNIPVISGMAKGIDSYSQTACLKAGGYTIAVLGCGVDICYPSEHKELMEKIIETGAVISEYPPGTKPDSLKFPKRNRIISAFSKKLLVVEADTKSGALITASFSKKYGREVYAVPNSVYSLESRGTNELIRKGAKIFIRLADLSSNMGNYKIIAKKSTNKVSTQLQEKEKSPILLHPIQQTNNYSQKSIRSDKSHNNQQKITQQNILSIISKEEKRIEELIQLFRDEDIDILEAISLLELDGKIKIEGGNIKIADG